MYSNNINNKDIGLDLYDGMDIKVYKILKSINIYESCIFLKEHSVFGLVDLSNFVNAIYVSCTNNNIGKIIIKPHQKIETLFCANNNLLELDELSNSLKELICNHNHIKALDNLPNSLQYLNCSNNYIELFKKIPDFILYLDCSFNKIKSLNNLPLSLDYLNCSHNNIKILDNLPNSLKNLNCSYNDIISLDFLPSSLIYLDCSYNHIENLDNLPCLLTEIIYSDNNHNYNIENFPKSIIKINKKYINFNC